MCRKHTSFKMKLLLLLFCFLGDRGGLELDSESTRESHQILLAALLAFYS